MPFVTRVTQTPTLPQILELEQVIIVDQTGPSVQLGVSAGSTCMVAEFLKGPFAPTEVFSSGEIAATYGGFSDQLSQDRLDTANQVQDGSGQSFEGNGIAHLKNRQFRRLTLQRVPTDMVATDGGTAKVFVAFEVTVNAAELDPDNALITGIEIVVPAGTRFADAAIGSATVIISLSQDIVIPKGTSLTGAVVPVSAVVGSTLDMTQDATSGVLTRLINTSGVATGGPLGATAFFVKGTTAAIAFIDTVLDPAIPGFLSTISSSNISTVSAVGAATAVFAPGTAAVSLNAKLASLYPAAIAGTAPGQEVTDDIGAIFAARNDLSPTIQGAIRGALWTNAQDASQVGRGRIAIVSANPSVSASSSNATTAKTNAKALPALFSGVNADRISVNFPYTAIYSTELGRNIFISPAGWKASLFSILAEEVESGVANTQLTTIQQMEPAFVANPFSRADYVAFKAKGLSALRRDRAVGWLFQSSVLATNPTTYPTRVKDNRRRFADFVQDTLAAIAAPYQKEPGTTERVDAITGEIQSFCDSLLSPNNPSLQRIEQYLVDPKSGNTPALTAVGIRTIIVKVRMLGDMDAIVFQTQIGPTVDASPAA
jgi:hypothetical protein